MTEDEIRQILNSYQTIAVVEMSDRPERPSYQVPLYLHAHGYKVIPVNSRAAEIAGLQAYPDLLAIPEPVEMVDIFARSEKVPAIVEDAIQIGAKVVWLQQGVVNHAAARRAEQAGLLAVEGMCIRAVHRYFFGYS